MIKVHRSFVSFDILTEIITELRILQWNLTCNSHLIVVLLHKSILVTSGFCSSRYIISQSGFGCKLSLSSSEFGNSLSANSSLVIVLTSFQDNLKDLAAFSTFQIVFLEAFNGFKNSFLDIPSDKCLKISLYFSSYGFKIKTPFL